MLNFRSATSIWVGCRRKRALTLALTREGATHTTAARLKFLLKLLVADLQFAAGLPEPCIRAGALAQVEDAFVTCVGD